MRKVVGEEEQEIEVELFDSVKMGTIVTEYDRFDKDAFAKPVDEIRTFKGVSPAMKKSMSRMEKRRVGEDAQSKQKAPQTIDGYNTFGVVMPPYNLDYLAKLYEESSPHGSAVRAKVSNIVGLGYEFVETPKTKAKIEKAENQEAVDKIRRNLERYRQDIETWLDTRNQEDDFAETLNKVWTDYESTGNGYIEIGRKDDGTIGYIGHCAATTIRIRRERDGFVQLVSNTATFFRNFGDFQTTDKVGTDSRPNELIHFKKYSPTNTYYGVPEIVSAIDAVAGNKFSSNYNLDYFEHKAVPRYVIIVKGGRLSEASQNHVVEFFQGALKGKNHRSLYVPLPADEDGRKSSFDMQPVEAGTMDASFIQYRKGNLNDILMAHRVPISKIGLAEGVSLAVARDADKTFKEQVCRPEQKIADKKINRIFKEITDALLFKLKELTLTDEDTLSKIDERYLRMGVIVPNEVRVRWGWPAIEGGDKPVSIKALAEIQAETSLKSSEIAAEQKAQANQTRTRDAARSANQSDAIGEGRNAQGEGRAQA